MILAEQTKSLRSCPNTGQRINFAGEIKTSHNTKRPISKCNLDKGEQVPTRRSQRLRELDEELRKNNVTFLKIFHITLL